MVLAFRAVVQSETSEGLPPYGCHCCSEKAPGSGEHGGDTWFLAGRRFKVLGVTLIDLAFKQTAASW
ncbi:hypothetical protein AOLI_G00141560 [Acnodon oligacanthus]